METNLNQYYEIVTSLTEQAKINGWYSNGKTITPNHAENDKLAIMAQGGNESAIYALIVRNAPIVTSVVNRYARTNKYNSEQLAEMFQDLIIEFLQCIYRWNPDKGAPFGCYAFRSISLKARTISRKCKAEYGTEESLDILERVIEDDYEAQLIDKIDDADSILQFYAEMKKKLTRTEIYILCSIYGAYGYPQKTVEQIAHETGNTKRQIYEISSNAKKKLK